MRVEVDLAEQREPGALGAQPHYSLTRPWPTRAWSDTAVRSRILVAEDDAVQAELLAETLRSAGHDVLVYPDGLSVLRALEVEATPADLLLTDLTMPHLTGSGSARR